MKNIIGQNILSDPVMAQSFSEIEESMFQLMENMQEKGILDDI